MNGLRVLATGMAVAMPLACTSISPKPATYLPNPTGNSEFVDGLHHLYGFNYAAAEASFRRTAELNPTSPLPQWGLAMALGPNLNEPEIPAERMQKAHEAAQRALALSKDAPQQTQALVKAVVARYAASAPFDQHKLDVAYSAAMKAAFERFPTDSDVATFFVESQMLAREGLAWTPDGQPHPDTAEGLWILETVLARDPLHVGANHYYIHLLDGSQTPERGLAIARRLEQIAGGAGHLLHMPSHVYMRVGDYRAAVAVNRKAVAADQSHGPGHGIYETLQIHSREYLAAAASMTGQSQIALDADPSCLY